MALGVQRGPAESSPSTPPLRATPAIAILCTSIWVLYQLSQSYPAFFPSPEAWRPFLLMPAEFSPLSMFTAPFIHLSPFHLGTNLVLLALFGPPLERRLGSGLFLLLYLGAGLLAALLHLSIALYFQVGRQQYASGASGAIAGLMGAYTVLNVEGPEGRAGRAPTVRKVLLALVVVWIFGELLQGCIELLNSEQEVAHWAHIGGFLFGLIIMVAMGQGTLEADQLLAEGGLLLHKGLYPEAERVLERAWSLQPHDPATVLGLARAKQAMGAGETARELLAAALEQEVRNGRPDQVIPFYLEVRTLAPRLRLSSEAFYRIGSWLSERGAWAEACGALERAAGPSSAPGTGREPSGPPSRPVGGPGPEPGASSSQDPLPATALYRAAEMAQNRLNQPERAAALLERLLREHPDSQWRATAERSLRQLRPDAGGDAVM
jgi:membrane associated rhomboid family serine protease